MKLLHYHPVYCGTSNETFVVYSDARVLWHLYLVIAGSAENRNTDVDADGMAGWLYVLC